MSMFQLLSKEEKEKLLLKIEEKTKNRPSKKKLYYYHFGIEKCPSGVLTPRLLPEDFEDLYR
ncbi:hypothetical protein [Tenacibaculum xiamenense]|uniref:hypothetical protein n=1 Tax=Tenacibaculum xiamenense TaxID=1261553 RepID=UPI0038B4AC83